MVNKFKRNGGRRGKTMENTDRIFRKRSKSTSKKRFNTVNQPESNS